MFVVGGETAVELPDQPVYICVTEPGGVMLCCVTTTRALYRRCVIQTNRETNAVRDIWMVRALDSRLYKRDNKFCNRSHT